MLSWRCTATLGFFFLAQLDNTFEVKVDAELLTAAGLRAEVGKPIISTLLTNVSNQSYLIFGKLP